MRVLEAPREEPAEEPPRAVPLTAESCDRAIRGGLGWLSSHPAAPTAEYGEFVETALTLALIAGALEDAPIGSEVRATLRQEVARWRQDVDEETASNFPHSDVAMLVCDCYAAEKPDERPDASTWRSFVRDSCDGGVTAWKSSILAGCLFPFMTADQKTHLEGVWRRDVDRRSLGVSGSLPSPRDAMAWYVPCHEVSILYAMGLAPVDVVPSEERERLALGFMGASTALRRRRTVDVFGEVLLSYRLLRGAPDHEFRRGMSFLLGIQNEDGSWGPSPEYPPGRSEPYRHPTIVTMWVTSLARKDLR